jgi:hypothetical protein
MHSPLLVSKVTKYLHYLTSIKTNSLLDVSLIHEALFEVGTYGELWTEFGIVADLIVSLHVRPET